MPRVFLTLCAARRLHLAKFERAVLALLLASNALAAAPDWADSEKPSEAAVDVSLPPPPPPFLTAKHAPPYTPYITPHAARADPPPSSVEGGSCCCLWLGERVSDTLSEAQAAASRTASEVLLRLSAHSAH